MEGGTFDRIGASSAVMTPRPTTETWTKYALGWKNAVPLAWRSDSTPRVSCWSPLTVQPATTVVHVAGSNGKGTYAILAAHAQAMGHTTVLFTSPVAESRSACVSMEGR